MKAEGWIPETHGRGWAAEPVGAGKEKVLGQERTACVLKAAWVGEEEREG